MTGGLERSAVSAGGRGRLFIAWLALASACAPEAVSAAAAEGGSDTCASTAFTWDSWGAGFFASYCRTCHASTTPERYGAPEGVDFDTLEDVRALAGAISITALEEESMPVGGGVPTEELVRLDQFLDCGL